MPTYKIYTKKTDYFESVIDAETSDEAYEKLVLDGGPEGYECFDRGALELVAIYINQNPDYVYLTSKVKGAK